MPEEKNRKVEWSFSFENINEGISNMLESIGISGDTEVKFGSFSESVGDATSAKVILNLTLGDATVMPLVGSDNLIEADVTYVGEVELSVKSDGSRKTVKLFQPRKGDVILKPLRDWLGSVKSEERLRWDVRLNPDVPMALEVNTGITANTLDLSKLQLTDLKMHSGTGRTTLTVPAMSERYQVKIGGGTGQLNLDVPAKTSADMQVNMGTGEANIAFGEDVDVKATVSGGVGACNITLPGSAAVRLEATAGLGSVQVPDHFMQVRSSNDFMGINKGGMWETPDYADATRKITLKYSGGIGKLTVVSGTKII